MKYIIPTVLLSAIAISGCSKSVPECGDPETIDVVKQISDREMSNQLGATTAKFFS